MQENGSGPLTWAQFVAYMEGFKHDLDETYSNRQACRVRHEQIDDDLRGLKRVIGWSASILILSFLGLVIFIVEGYVF